MKKVILIFIITIVVASVVLAGENGLQAGEWDNVESFTCYYGDNKEELQKTSRFDVAILESRKLAVTDIKRIKESGVYILGYVSIGETAELEKGDGKGPDGSASYYFDSNGDGKPDRNPHWGSYYVDVGSEVWQDRVLQELVHEVIVAKGCHGVFLDTVDTVDVRPESRNSMIELIWKIRDEYPEIKIVINRGFSIVPDIAPVIDGLMYESFTAAFNYETSLYTLNEPDLNIATSNLAVSLNQIRKEYFFPVFTLDYALPDQKDLLQRTYDRAWAFDFIPYVSVRNLDQIFIHEVKPQTRKGELALSGETIPGGEAVQSAGVDPANIALAANGAEVKVDSMFPVYDCTAVNDGLRNDENLHWSQIAWASGEFPGPHWIEIRFPEEKEVSRVVIVWALDNGLFYNSQEVTVQYLAGDDWIDIVKVTESDDSVEVSETEFEEVKTMGIKIYQEEGKGNPRRENLMWVSEVEIYSS